MDAFRYIYSFRNTRFIYIPWPEGNQEEDGDRKIQLTLNYHLPMDPLHPGGFSLLRMDIKGGHCLAICIGHGSHAFHLSVHLFSCRCVYHHPADVAPKVGRSCLALPWLVEYRFCLCEERILGGCVRYWQRDGGHALYASRAAQRICIMVEDLQYKKNDCS